MADTTDFKNGLVLKIDNKLMQIVEFQHVKPGKGPAFVRTKLKDVVSGKTVDKTWNAGVKVETATVDRRDMTYLYNDGTSYVVMDEKTFEQFELPAEGGELEVWYESGVPAWVWWLAAVLVGIAVLLAIPTPARRVRAPVTASAPRVTAGGSHAAQEVR